MLASLLLTYTTCALVLLVPATVVMVRAGSGRPGRHADVAVSSGPARAVRLAAAATAVGLGSLGAAAVLGTGPAPAAVVAAILAGSVVAWSGQDGGTWSVRGVTVWALGSSALLGLIAVLAFRVLQGSTSPASAAVAGAAWLALLPASSRLAVHARTRCAAVAGPPRARSGPRGGSRGAVLAALVSAGTAAVVVGATSMGGPASDAPSRAGRDGAHTPSQSPDRSSTPSLAGSGSNGDGRGSAASSGPTSRRTPTADDEAGGTAPAPSAGTSGPSSSAPSPTPSPTDGPSATKTPGYLKEKPNRPDGAPSPGRGRPDLR